METYDLIDIDKKTLEQIRDHSCADAPWRALGPGALEFLEAGLASGVKWKTHTDVLVAFTQPKSRAAEKRQAQARQKLDWSANLGMYPSGILMFAENEAGRWRAIENGEQRFLEQNTDMPEKGQILGELMEVYWPDIPPLAWNRLRELLVRREFKDVNGGCSEVRYARDYLDFGKAYLALNHANKLIPQQVVDWDQITRLPVAGKAGPRP